jgi:hypothetical protein
MFVQHIHGILGGEVLLGNAGGFATQSLFQYSLLIFQFLRQLATLPHFIGYHYDIC